MMAVNLSFQRLLDYEQRSQNFEPGQTRGQQQSGEWAGVVFRMGDARLACSVERVHEFLPLPAYTPVPGTKPWILGLANLRGELLTIVDLDWFLSGKRSSVSMRTRLLVATLRGRPVGLLVDEVFGQRNFVSKKGKKTQLAKDSPLKSFVEKQYRSGNEIWQELDLEALFSTPEFLNGAVA